MIVCWATYILNKTWPLLGKLGKNDENLTNQLRKYKRSQFEGCWENSKN